MRNAIIIFYVVWFVVSVINQFNIKSLRKYKRFDIFHLIPGWRFFAPAPVKNDYHLLYRDKVNGVLNDFTLIEIYNNKSFFKIFFNPKARIKKTFFAFATSYSKEDIFNKNDSSHIISIGYLTILSIVMKLPAQKNSQRQFIIIRTVGNDTNFEPQILMTSNFHDIE